MATNISMTQINAIIAAIPQPRICNTIWVLSGQVRRCYVGHVFDVFAVRQAACWLSQQAGQVYLPHK